MQTLQKFKQINDVEIPEDWSISLIKDIAEIRGRIGWKGMTTKDYRKEGPILLGVTNISKNFMLKLDEITRISEERYKESPEIIVKDKDILLAKSGATTGKVCYVERLLDRATVNAAVNIIRSKENVIYPKYLFYFLSWDKMQKLLFQKSSAGAQPNLFQRDTKKIPIIIPLLSEQQNIASILSNIDKLIQKTEQIIEQTQRLKKGLMQRLLTKGIGHTLFKKTELGDIPEEWQYTKMKMLSTLSKDAILTGPFGSMLHSYDYVKEGTPLILIKNIQNGSIDDKNIPKISQKDVKRLERYKVRNGDIVFSRVGRVGSAALIKEKHNGWLISVLCCMIH